MTPRQFLEACGWARGAGGQYYFPSDGYPHLHLGTTGVGMELGDIGNNVTQANKKAAYTALKPKIDFVAISNGAGGGRNFVTAGRETVLIKSAATNLRQVCGDETSRTVGIGYELAYILNTYGFTL